MNPLCIYHGNCADGFGAAWVFKRYADREFDFHPGVYQNDPPDVTVSIPSPSGHPSEPNGRR